MAVLTHLETDTGTNVDISAATAVGAYTANADKLIMVDVSIDAVAGNGDYIMYVTRQIGGSGSAYRILPQTTMAAASGLTAISGQSGWITVRNGDVLTVYIDGLAGDTSTPDWSTRWFESAGVTAAAVADAVWDEAISGHTTGTTFGGKNQKVVPSETINDYKADVSALTNVTLTAAYDKAKDDVLTPLGVVDGVVDAIKAKTDLIPATPAVADEYDAALAAIQADLDNPDQYKADVSGLATAAALTTVDNEVGVIEGIVDAIKLKTDNLPADPADDSDIDAQLAAIKAETASILEDTGTTIPATITTIDNEIAVIDGNVDAILDDTGTSGVLLSTSALTSIFDDEVIVGSYNFSDLLKIMASALAGKLSGGGTTTLTFRGVDDTSDVIVTTVDANKNRTNVVIAV